MGWVGGGGEYAYKTAKNTTIIIIELHGSDDHIIISIRSFKNLIVYNSVTLPVRLCWAFERFRVLCWM